MKPRIVFHVVAVVVLATAVAAAQSHKENTKPSQPAASQDRQYSAPSVSEREAGSGMATGKRQHQPMKISQELADDSATTGSGSSQPSGFQSGVVTARETSSGMATGRRSGSVVVVNDDSEITAREAGSGMATGNQAQFNPREYSRNSAHAAESLDGASKDAGKVSQAQSNPMYKDGGLQGSNPMYQGKDRTAAPSSGGNGSKPAEYKDGEDGTTRARPGNHKPAK